MSSFGNLLTTGSSTPWSPFQDNINAMMRSVITPSSVHNNQVANYGGNYVTGSSEQRSNPYGQAMGQTPQRWKLQAASGMAWIADLDAGPDNDPHLLFDLDQGIGRTEALDSFIIQSPGDQTTWQAGGYQISGSNDNTNFTPLTSSVFYPGGSGINTKGYDATIIFSNSTAYRYYKVRLSDYGGTFAGFAGIIAWDSSLFKNQLNLFNPNEVNVTASFIETSTTDLEKFTSFPRENYGWYFDEQIGTVDFNWDEPKLFRGFFGPTYSTSAFFPGIVQFYKSNTGKLNDWELFSTVNVFDTQNPEDNYEQYFIDLQTPIKTQYLRIVMYAEGDDTPANNLLMWNGWMYEMLSASAPPIPINLTASAFQNNVGLTWSQNSGSDNRLVDVIYNIERSSNGGSTYDPIITLSGSVTQTSYTSSLCIPVQTSYIDSNLADGTYLYRIQSQNQHHLTTSSFVASTSVTVPATSGGGTSKKIYTTNKGNILINPNDTILIEL